MAAGLAVPSGVAGPVTAGAPPPLCERVRTVEGAAIAEAARCGHPVQISGLTSERVEAFALPSGSIQSTISPGIARVRRGNDWIPLDLTLIARADGTVVPAAHANNLEISGASSGVSNTLAALDLDAGRLALEWNGRLPQPDLAGPRATFVDALPGIDVVIEATPLGFEQFFVVKSRTAVAHVKSLPFNLLGSAVAFHRMERDDTLVMSDANGAEIARVPAPMMWDSRPALADGTPARVSPIRTVARARAGARGVELTLTPDPAWMSDPGSVFPVVIDPTVSPASSAFSTTVVQGSDADRSAKPDMWIGKMAQAPTITRSFVHWPAATFAGKQIVSARVYLWNFYSTTCAPHAWEIWPTGPTSATTYWSTQPAWLDADPAVTGDQPAATSTETAGLDATCDDNWSSIDGQRFFQYTADAGQSTAYMGIKSADESNSDGWKNFRTLHWGTPAHQPYATITYNSYPVVTSRATVPSTSCIVGSSRPNVNTLTPGLQATVTDADGTAMSVTFEWRTLTGATALGTVVVPGVASGATATATIPVGGIPQPGSYRWRARANDGIATVSSSWCEFTLYVFAPPAVGCTSGLDSDFNGDGVRDVAIADAEAVVGGRSRAGAIHIVDGASGAVTTLHQDLAEIPDGSESGAQFGRAIATADLNDDGCADLVVGAPRKNVGTVGDAGVVYLLLGSPQGLAKGPAAVTYTQGANGVPEIAESFDFFGFSVAAGETAAGQPYLLIGAPNENRGLQSSSGTAHYISSTANVLLSRDAAGVPGEPVRDAQMGYAVAASPHHIVIGSPGDTTGGDAFAGSVQVFSHTLTAGVPTFVADLHQDVTGISDSAEPGDQFGRSVAVAPYRPVGAPAGQPDSFLLVGVPTEDFTSTVDSGLVQRFHLTQTGVTEVTPGVTQSTPGISDGNATGDFFGEKVLIVNTNPAAEATPQTLLAAVGAPGEDIGTHPDAGMVHVFPAAATAFTVDVDLYRNPTTRLPGIPIDRELVGFSLGANSQNLYIGTPFGDAAVYAFTWTALAALSNTPAQTWRPGVGGLPAAEVTFGFGIA